MLFNFDRELIFDGFEVLWQCLSSKFGFFFEFLAIDQQISCGKICHVLTDEKLTHPNEN